MLTMKFTPGEIKAEIIATEPVSVGFMKAEETLIPSAVVVTRHEDSWDIRVSLEPLNEDAESGPFQFVLPTGRINLILDGAQNGIWGIEANTFQNYTILADDVTYKALH